MSKPIPLERWQSEMFTRGKLACKFRCPVCGNVASPNDWKALKPDLTNPDRAAVECIGRIMPRDQVLPAFAAYDSPPGDSRERKGEPCDYAAFGLFDVCTAHVEMPDGKIVPVFEFA